MWGRPLLPLVQGGKDAGAPLHDRQAQKEMLPQKSHSGKLEPVLVHTSQASVRVTEDTFANHTTQKC